MVSNWLLNSFWDWKPKSKLDKFFMLFFGAFILFVLIISIPQDCENKEYVPVQDIPRYTADQVINVAKAKSPTCMPSVTTPTWETTYAGNGKWVVVKKCVFPQTGAVFSSEGWYFYENSGVLEPIK